MGVWHEGMAWGCDLRGGAHFAKLSRSGTACCGYPIAGDECTTTGSRYPM